MSCGLAKTWPKTTLKGGEGKLVKWGFGDARCEVSLNMSRAVILSALTSPSYSLVIPEHSVTCVVESDGEMKPVEVSLAPRIDFKNGRADKVWVNLKKATGPTSITTTVKTAASLEDTFGIFHKSMIKSINKFVSKQCVEKYGPNAAEFAAKEEARKAARRAARAAKGEGTAASETTDAAAETEPVATAEPPKSAVPEVDKKEPAAQSLPKEAAASPAPVPAVVNPKDKPAAAAPAERTSPAAAAKREAARAASTAKPKKAAPVQMELRSTAPWAVKPAEPKGP